MDEETISRKQFYLSIARTLFYAHIFVKKSNHGEFPNKLKNSKYMYYVCAVHSRIPVSKYM